MPIVTVSNSSSPVVGAGNYITDNSKTVITTSDGEKELVSAKDCNPETAIKEMQDTKKIFNKTDGRTYKHYVQSFAPGDVSPEQAHEIAQEFADNSQFEGYEVLVATHTDQDHIHSHFIVNSVSFEDGKKYNESPRDLQKLKDLSNELALNHGISPPEPSQEITADNTDKYQAIKRHYNPNDDYTSEIVETAETIHQSKKQADSWQEFLEFMEDKNYNVKWKSPKTGNEYKYVTYTHPEGRKFRDKNIEKTLKVDYSKEAIVNEIQSRQQREQQQRGQNESDRRGLRGLEHNREGKTSRERERDFSGGTSQIMEETQRELQAIEERTKSKLGEDREQDGQNREQDERTQERKREPKKKTQERGGRTL